MIHLWLICQINFFGLDRAPLTPFPFDNFQGVPHVFMFFYHHIHTPNTIYVLYYAISIPVLLSRVCQLQNCERNLLSHRDLSWSLWPQANRDKKTKTWGIRNLIRTARSAKIFSHLEFHLAYCIKLGQTFGFPKFNHLMNIDKVLLREPIEKCPKRAKTQFLGPKTHVFFCKNGKD